MCINNRSIQIRLTSTEKDEIVRRMQAEGYHNLSMWIRMKLLKCPGENGDMRLKIEEIHRFVTGQNEKDDEGDELRNKEFVGCIDIPVCQRQSEAEE